MNAEEQTEAAERERVKGFDRTKRVISYHIYRLHKRAKRYERSPADEERYYRALKSLGYLVQVLTAAQRSAFEEELSIVEGALKEIDKTRVEYARLKGLEAKYVEIITAQTSKESGSPQGVNTC